MVVKKKLRNLFATGLLVFAEKFCATLAVGNLFYALIMFMLELLETVFLCSCFLQCSSCFQGHREKRNSIAMLMLNAHKMLLTFHSPMNGQLAFAECCDRKYSSVKISHY